MHIEFWKYQGAGNDFVIVDNRLEKYSNLTNLQVHHLCDRRFGIGADGLMLLNNKAGYDFEMIYYNADGKPGSMCGNGARCIVSFAYRIGIHKTFFKFLAADGEHEADIDLSGVVRLKMSDVNNLEVHSNYFIVNTGSPHYVKLTGDVMKVDVKSSGRTIRYDEKYAKEGINVNFVESIGEDEIFVRTYERGVEDETLSCGTGVTAAALVSAHNDNGFNRVEVKTQGGPLSVEFEKIDEKHFRNIWLVGPGQFVYKGEINIE